MATPVESPEFANKLLEAIETAGLGLTIVHLDGASLRRIYSNRIFCELTGYTADELRDVVPIAGLVPPGERERLFALHQAFLATGSYPPTIETAILDRRGTVIPVDVSMASVPHAGGSATVSFVRDNRARLQVADALRESEARFRQLAEASPDSIVVIQRGQVVYANPSSARVLGFDTPEEFKARPLDQLLIDPEETRIMGERIGRIMRGERLGPREYAGRRKDGGVAVMEISTTRINYDGAPAVLALGRDTGERRAWHAELLRNDRLASIGILAASVAHEINNPLTYMMLQLERLSALATVEIGDPALGARINELVASAREGGGRVRTIVRDLLTVARHDHDAAPVQVETALDTALKLAGPTLSERAEVVRRDTATPPVVANVGRLSQVFLNLLLNAADAFDGAAPANRVTVDVDVDGAHVRVTIADNGRGIPAELVGQLFQPLFTTKPRGSGTGLGLSICKSIVTELGGTITASSAPGTGTRMEVRLPAAPPADEDMPTTERAASGGRRRVAIIDDDVLLARSFSALVATRHEVETFTAPRAALAALIDGAPFDHVLCDVNMPGLNGPDLYAELCARRPEYVGRFTMVTGGAPTARLELLLADGVVGLLRKPFDMATLLAILDRV